MVRNLDLNYEICPVCGAKVSKLNHHIAIKSKKCKAHDMYQRGRLGEYFNSDMSLLNISRSLSMDRHTVTKLFRKYFGMCKSSIRNESVRRFTISNKKIGKPNNHIKSNISYEFVKKSFESEGYKLLSERYINNKQKLKYICPNGHVNNISWCKWQAGQRCPNCSKYRNRYSIDIVRKSFEFEGYKLLTNKYINSKQRLEYICPKGHRHTITWSRWLLGARCPCVNKKLKPTIDFIREDFKKHGALLLSTEYSGCDSLLDFVCENGHMHKVSWSNWRRNHTCGICSGKVLADNHKMDDITFNGYIIIKIPKDTHDLMHLICPNGHDYYVSWANWNSKGYRCPRCTNVGTSYQETELLDFIKSAYDREIIDRDRSMIPPYELDIIIPDKKIAIEYCGLYWHSELAGKDRKYHLNKLNNCLGHGYRLITIFEDEWIHKKDIVKSMLKYKIDISDYRAIYARNCKVMDINTSIAKKFCNSNHIQGYGNSGIKLGLFCDDELVSILTMSKLSIAKGHRHQDLVWELNRFCSKPGRKVIGGASKLLKYFERNYEWEKIISYADRRWSDGNLYEKIGFSFDSYTEPNYWYFKNHGNRIHRFSLRKKPSEPSYKTEWELRQEQGWNRIWDCGSLKFIKYNNM